MNSRSDHVGDIAIVLHTHMPYVEGFGTYPFGEEWLFDAVIRSYLPVLEVAAGLTMSVTPVLADQLEAPGVADRLIEFTREFRFSSALLDASDADPELHPACEAEAERYAIALDRLETSGGDVIAAFADAQDAGRVELIASGATHAVMPLLATTAARRLQIDAGLRSHRRRFGVPRGWWLPECAYEPGIEELLAAEGIMAFCVDQSAYEPPASAMRPIARGSTTAFTIDWEAISWLWSLDGYPSDPRHADFHRKSLRGARAWAISGEPYDPAAADDRAREQGREFAAAAAARLGAHRDRAGDPGLLTFAIDTELLGHWWWEGPSWLQAALESLPEHGVEAVTLREARERHAPEDRPLRASTWGDRKDLRTWDSRAVADIAWGARRAELRLVRELAGEALSRDRALRATRELLALQASDWAFLDYRGQAGDYPWQRVLGHAQALFEAIDSAERVNPALRNLAPDLSLAPLIEP